MDIGRDTFPVDDDRYDDIDEVRLYWDKDEDDPPKLPSVTTILKTRDDDKSNLYDWQDRNDGEGDNANHKHLFWYKRHRGTLCHWYALKTLNPDLEWSPDEAQSMWALGNVSQQNDPERYPETWDATPREVLYSVLKAQHAVESWGEFYDLHPHDARPSYFEDELVEQYKRDRDFFVEAFERICSKLDINTDSVVAVEQYLFEDEHEFAGQVDLVYERNGETRVADLKTSSGCYTKHKLQGAAYGKAVERSDDFEVTAVDALDVVRIHPDSGQYAVHTSAPDHGMHVSTYWRRDYDDLWDEFADLAMNFDVEPIAEEE